VDALVAAYPDRLAGHHGRGLYWRDGTIMPVSDDKENNWESFCTTRPSSISSVSRILVAG
jgi:hypothetical protein